mgnify:CR=1 FL=1
MSPKRQPRPRVWFTGTVQTRTALHIGTGSSLSVITDAPILRGADGLPLVPGSSMKGALRSACERLLRALGHRACMVFGDEEPGNAAHPTSEDTRITRCLTTDSSLSEVFYKLRRGDTLEAAERDIADRRWQLRRDEQRAFRLREDLQQRVIEKELCRACLTFGSQFMAGRIRVPDLRIDGSSWFGATEIRDGVGIDRDTGTAAHRIKFDLEVLPAGAAFRFELIAEPEADLTVVALAVGELLQGSLPLGGRTTRGLGEVKLVDFCIHEVDLANASQLVGYLTGGKEKGTVYRGDAAVTRLESYLESLTSGTSGGQHAA